MQVRRTRDGVLQSIECRNSHNNIEEDGGAAPHIETAPDHNHTLHERVVRTNLEMNIPDSAGLEQTPGTQALCREDASNVFPGAVQNDRVVANVLIFENGNTLLGDRWGDVVAS